jgi:hypothetical protein
MAHTSAALEHRKVFVEVTVKVSPEGEVRPLSITFEDGIKYEIDRLKQRCRAHATKVGGVLFNDFLAFDGFFGCQDGSFFKSDLLAAAFAFTHTLTDSSM